MIYILFFCSGIIFYDFYLRYCMRKAAIKTLQRKDSFLSGYTIFDYVKCMSMLEDKERMKFASNIKMGFNIFDWINKKYICISSYFKMICKDKKFYDSLRKI